MLRVLLFQVSCVLTEIIALEILATLSLLILLLAFAKSLFKGNFLGFEALDLLLLLLLLFLDTLSLCAIDRQLIIGLLGLDFAFEYLALTL